MEETVIFCPDCRGKFGVLPEDVIEGEILECPLCGAEIEILQENPLKIRLFSGEYDF